MGITGLLPYLEAATRPCHISEFKGGSVAVDSYCFLHKGANAAAEQLARGEDNQIYVQYCVKYIKMLLSYNIHPIMVFDGRNLPAKADTEAKRRESRKTAKQRGVELLRLGKTEEARNYLRQCIDITPKMAHNLIEACRQLNVDSIVAPYESDAQLTFFDMRGVVDAVITEDSDLILFGCKKVVFKMDMSGAGRLVESDKIWQAMKMRPDQYSFEKFRYMCILSGCDYLDSLYGIGLKKAEKFIKLTAETDPERFLNKLPAYLKMKNLVITDEYKVKFMTANATFLHQIVFDPFKKSLVYLHNPQKTGTNPDYLVNCGQKFDDELAYQIALGNKNPNKDEIFSDWKPEKVPTCSIWSAIFKKRISANAAKETRQREFKSFFKIEESDNTISAQLEREKCIEDIRIERELSVYMNKKLEVEEQTVAESSNGPEKNEKIRDKSNGSPFLARNPFLKKKISKFPRTDPTDPAVVVKSRFFSEEITSTTNEINTADDTQINNNYGRIKLESQSEDKGLVTTLQPDKKRKLLGPCRSVGLKKISGGKSQKTLHNFFHKMKKEN